MAETLRFGIEEEYFLSDATTRGIVRKVARGFFPDVRKALPGEAQREMLQSQIEIATPVLETAHEARRVLSRLRLSLAGIAAEHGMLLLACGTHPSAAWARQRVTQAARYDRLMRELQMIGSRNQICGLHVHVEIEDEEERIALMGRILPDLPLLLALSTSSPFWQGRRTGLMSYRLSANAELPRTGLPELFSDPADYRTYVETMVAAGAIKDASYIWWAIRPSQKHPTLELRIADSCTRLDDTLAIAALYRCLLRHLRRNPRRNADVTAAGRAIAVENLWLAQRHGVHGALICAASRTMRPIATLIEDLIAELAGDAEALSCTAELAHCRDMASNGTSADVQLAVFEEARAAGGNTASALAAVVDWIAAETRPDGKAADGSPGDAPALRGAA